MAGGDGAGEAHDARRHVAAVDAVHEGQVLLLHMGEAGLLVVVVVAAAAAAAAVAADAAANAASHVKPSEDSLAQIDRPADDNVWHDAPDFSKDALKKTIQQLYKGDASGDTHDTTAAQQFSSTYPTAAEADAAGGAHRHR